MHTDIQWVGRILCQAELHDDQRDIFEDQRIETISLRNVLNDFRESGSLIIFD